MDLQTRIEHCLGPVSETARLDAQVLLAHVLGRSRAWLLAHPEVEPTQEQLAALEISVERAAAGEPLPYIIGGWEFYGHWFELSPATLVPRPETELLVERAIHRLAGAGSSLAADVGTGSGCIAISLALALPNVRVLAVDRSADALQVARRNASRLGASSRIDFVQADLLPPLAHPLDLLCANLPYIPTAELDRLPVARFEPRMALDGGPDGLALIRRLLSRIGPSLAPGAALLLEIEAGQGTPALDLGRALFPGAQVEVLPDLAGQARLLEIELPGEG